MFGWCLGGVWVVLGWRLDGGFVSFDVKGIGIGSSLCLDLAQSSGDSDGSTTTLGRINPKSDHTLTQPQFDEAILTLLQRIFLL